MTATVIARRMNAVPVRTARETWQLTAELLADPGTPEHAELMAAAAAATMVISGEVTRTTPIVVTADTGPRVRIYTLHGEDAFGGTEDETVLPSRPCTVPGWTVQLPCLPDDLDDVTAALSSLPHVWAYAAEDDAATVAASTTAPTARSGRLTVDRSALGAS